MDVMKINFLYREKWDILIYEPNAQLSPRPKHTIVNVPDLKLKSQVSTLRVPTVAIKLPNRL